SPDARRARGRRGESLDLRDASSLPTRTEFANTNPLASSNRRAARAACGFDSDITSTRLIDVVSHIPHRNRPARHRVIIIGAGFGGLFAAPPPRRPPPRV